MKNKDLSMYCEFHGNNLLLIQPIFNGFVVQIIKSCMASKLIHIPNISVHT